MVTRIEMVILILFLSTKKLLISHEPKKSCMGWRGVPILQQRQVDHKLSQSRETLVEGWDLSLDVCENVLDDINI